ncbi:O-antigen ligase family protein [Sphingopyxis sp. 22461]|uniref:O-antigen ligase family protein n=1 Tax=Sphingopyxis sp. 22461 TaxID=3453923 RepID=UPI003F84048D
MAHSKSGARGKKARLEFLTQRFSAFSGPSADRSEARAYWALIGFLILVFLTGGASRSDVQSLLILRPLAVVFCGFALLSITKEQIRTYRFFFLMAGLIFILVGIHLIPLPPAIWQALPGREVIIEIDNAVGNKDLWRPITMTPSAGANAFFSLFVPLAVLLLIVQLDGARLQRLATPILILGAISGVIGIFQVAGDARGPLYFYRITNPGAAVGFFSNRNHQAILLLTMFPIIAFFASKSMKTENAIKLRRAVAVGIVALLIPLILVTGSRLGLLLGLISLTCSWFIYRKPEATGVRKRTERKNYTVAIMAALGVMLLALVTVLASRAEALQRLLGTNFAEEARVGAWGITSQIAWKNMPLGSGAGSFVELYRMVEPVASLTPVYFNHAHNDWLEVWMTFGVPGVALIALAGAGYVVAAWKLFTSRTTRPNSTTLLAQTGAAIILFFALSSIVDYPLRTPSLACLFVVACCWMRFGLGDHSISAGNSRGV